MPPASAVASVQVAPAAPRGADVAQAAARYVGVREATGRNDGPEVAMFLRSTGLGEGHAWCGAFAHFAHGEAGVRLPGKASAYAWSPTWFAVRERLVAVEAVEAGDVIGIYFASLGRIAHMAVVEASAPGRITTIEGNTNDALSRDGDGVYRKYRKPGTIRSAARWW